MKAILVINTSGNYGGAEKRIVSLFDHINRERNDYILIINRSLYDLMTGKGILSGKQNIHIIDIPFDKKGLPGTSGSSAKKPSEKNSSVKALLGKYKYFLKTVYQWHSFAKQLKTILNESQIKTVYTIWQGGIWGRKVLKKLNIKIIYGANSNLVWHLEKDLLNRYDSQYRILRDAGHIDFLSSGLVEELKKLMPENDLPEKYSVSPCSFINYTNFHAEYPKKNNVVFSGRLVKLKNPQLFLEAVKIFNSGYETSGNVYFYVLGTGPEEQNMKDFVRQQNIENIRFEGKVPNPEEYLKSSKVFISIQQTENYPSQALMEAMACENAVIASDVGETRRMVTEKEGILVNLIPGEIAEALNTLFSDEPERMIKGKNARKKVMTEHTIDRFKEYFYELMR